MISENERRLADANEKLVGHFSETEKRQAAEFLVQQIELLKEERRALLDDNDCLNLKMQEFSAENEQLRKENQIIDFLQSPDSVYSNNESEDR